jgi:hypothetical protein
LAAQKTIPTAHQVFSTQGNVLAEISQKSGKPIFAIQDKDFGDWLADNLDQIHRDFSQTRGD